MISKNKRFELLSFNFQDLNGVIWDNLKEERIEISIYGLVDLLNDVSQTEFDLYKLKECIVQKLDEMIDKGDVYD